MKGAVVFDVYYLRGHQAVYYSAIVTFPRPHPGLPEYRSRWKTTILRASELVRTNCVGRSRIYLLIAHLSV